MPLRQSPCLTLESLAARRANALKSTGPRTPRGKARVSFNALKHGQYAARSARLRERLIRAGYERQEELYGRIRSRIAQTFGTPDRHTREDADRLANVVWCRATRTVGRRPTSSPSAAESVSRNKAGIFNKTKGLSTPAPFRSMGIVNPWSSIGCPTVFR